MRKLVCEMCGSSDIIKQEGLFVCQTCGLKYTLEEARKMMVEGVVEVTGTVKVDNSAAIDNYLTMAKNALEASNNEEAENYANKIIELDPEHSEAWLIKGKAAGWQSKANNNRLGESITAWINSVKFADDDLRPLQRISVASAYSPLFMAMIQLRCNNFSSLPDKSQTESLINDLHSGIDMMNTLMVKAGVTFDRGFIYNQLAQQINEAACGGYKTAQDGYGPGNDNKAKWQWDKFTDRCDNCVKILDEANELCRAKDLGVKISRNMVTIATHARDSSSYKYSDGTYWKEYSFTDSAKKSRGESIDRYRRFASYYGIDQTEKALKLIQGDRTAAETENGRKIYWQEHAEEKAQLDAEMERLKAENTDADAQMKSLPISKTKEDTRRRSQQLEEEKGRLGLFKGKEKKALQAQIDELNTLYKRQSDEETAAKKPLQEKIDANKKRIREIEAEFTKSRGMVPLSAEDNSIPGALEDGKFTVTPKALADHLAARLPGNYHFKEIKAEGSPLDDFGRQYKLVFTDDNSTAKEKDATVNIFCAASGEDAPITCIILDNAAAGKSEHTPSDMDLMKRRMIDWCTFGAYSLMAVTPGLNRSEAEQICAKARYSVTKTAEQHVAGKGVRCEYASKTISLLGLISFSKDLLLIRPAG